MSDTRQGHLRPDIASSESEGSDVIDLCCVSSGDEDDRSVGSPSVDSEATLSEASDAGPAAAGDRLWFC